MSASACVDRCSAGASPECFSLSESQPFNNVASYFIIPLSREALQTLATAARRLIAGIEAEPWLSAELTAEGNSVPRASLIAIALPTASAITHHLPSHRKSEKLCSVPHRFRRLHTPARPPSFHQSTCALRRLQRPSCSQRPVSTRSPCLSHGIWH